MELTEKVKTGVKTLNGFDLSYDGVTSLNWGDIVPIVCKEMIPGDKFTCDATTFVRLAPLASPTYGRIHGYINYFFVPNRILFRDDQWEKLITGGTDGNYPNNFPYFTVGDINRIFAGLDSSRARDTRKLFSYFNLPDPSTFNSSALLRLSPLPFMAYQRIFGDYYFPWGYENDAFAEEVYFSKLDISNGANVNSNMFGNSLELLSLRHACFKKDYLTTAQTRPQRGGEVFEGTYEVDDSTQDSSTGTLSPENPSSQGSGYNAAGTGISMLTHRWAMQLQKYLQRNSVAGARYFEQMLARFGVKIPAERLQRSQYLGGKDFFVQISDVTAQSDTSTASLGSMAGKGVAVGQGGISYSADEHGFFIALLHLMPESGCVQGIDRMFQRFDRERYFTPEFEDTGNQPIYNAEVWGDLYTSVSSTTDVKTPEESGVFGYIPRYAEYKFSTPHLGGDFRLFSTNESMLGFGTMGSMHLYRLFNLGSSEDIPVLTQDFLTLDDSKAEAFNRVFQDTNNDFDHFWVNLQVSLGAQRPMLGYAEASTGFINDEKGRIVSLPLFGTRL